MKGIIKILVLFPLFSVSLHAQFSAPGPYQQSKENFTKSSKDSTSLMVEQITQYWGNNTWNNSSKILNSYNSNRQKELYTSYNWQYNDWEPQLRIFYLYNTLSQLVQRYNVESYFNWDTTVNVRYYYDTKGREVERISWLLRKGDFGYDQGRTQTQYDSLDNVIGVVNQKFDNNSWVNSSRTTYKYDTRSNLVEQIIQGWREDSWKSDVVYKFDYDINGNRIRFIQLLLKNAVWDSVDMHVYNFNSLNQLLNQNTFVKQNGIWIKDSKFGYAYDSKGNWIFQMFQYWADSILVNGGMNFYEYDQFGKLSQEVEKGWRGNNWEFNIKIAYQHDPDGNLINKTFYK